MIGYFEGALSSRRKRADIIIRTGGKKSRNKCGAEGRNAGCYFYSRKGGKMKYFMGLKFSPAGPRKHGAIISVAGKNARRTFPNAPGWPKMRGARRRAT
jgi:hypothetical protein